MKNPSETGTRSFVGSDPVLFHGNGRPPLISGGVCPETDPKTI